MLRKLFVISVIVLLLGSCIPAQPAAPTEAVTVEPTNRDLQGGKPFRFVHPNRQHPVVRLMMLGFVEACRDLDVDCVDAGLDFVDIPALLVKGEQAITLGSSGVVYTQDAVFYENGKAIVNAGIPLVATHIQLKNNEIPGLYAWVATDNIDYSQRSADRMAELIGCKGSVAVTLGSYSDLEGAVYEAFKARMQEKCPGIIVHEPYEEGFDSPPAIAKMVAIFRSDPDISAVYSTTGAGAYNWAQAAMEMGYAAGQVKIAGMDYSRQNLDLVKSGWVDFLVGQPLYEEHYRAVECLVGKLKGDPCELANPFPAPLVDKSNMDIYYGFCDRSEAMEVK